MDLMLARIRSRLFWWDPAPVVFTVSVVAVAIVGTYFWSLIIVALAMLTFTAWVVTDESYEPPNDLDEGLDKRH